MLAVILTARAERDNLEPYPLLPLSNGECLLDRTLSILRESGCDRIVLVTGFRSELFEKYAAPDVAIVVNKDYKYTASMSSLAAARGLIDEDFLLVEGDTFFEKSLISHMVTDDHTTMLVATEESGSGDEAFVETCQGFVTKVSKDRHQISHYCGELVGVVKISLDTYHRMLNLWDRSDNPLLNYEYALMDCTSVLERPYVFLSNLIWGDVDTREDFHQLDNYIYPRLRRKEDPFDAENIKSHIKTILPNVDKNSIAITQIGGMSNKNFKITAESKEYVLRVPGLGADGMVDRVNEEQNSRLASQLGITPAIKYFNHDSGIKLTDYITNAETLNRGTIQRRENMDKIVGIFHKLHNSHYRLNNDFNVFAEIRKYEDLLLAAQGRMYEGYDVVREEICGLENELNLMGVELRPCHNDLVAENFIKDRSGTLYLIDWEYSGMNDPLWDLAALFLESEFSEENMDYFLSSYYMGEIPQNTVRKIIIYQVLMDILWSIWTCIKETKGDDFGSYGYDRFARAKKNLLILKEIN